MARSTIERRLEIYLASLAELGVGQGLTETAIVRALTAKALTDVQARAIIGAAASVATGLRAIGLTVAADLVVAPPPPSPVPTLGPLTLAAFDVIENSPTGTVVGGVLGMQSSGTTLAVIDGAGGRFTRTGNSISVGSVLPDYEDPAYSSHEVPAVLRETHTASGIYRDTTLKIRIINVPEAPELGDIGFGGMPDKLTIGTPLTNALTGAKTGQAITASGLPAGLTIDGAARTWTWSGTGSAATGTVTFKGDLADSPNSGRTNQVSVLIVAAASSGGGATVAPTSPQTSVSQNGVTFTFDQPYPVGQYGDGNYFVVGSPVVTAVTPASTAVTDSAGNADRTVHGLMVNPQSDGQAGGGSEPHGYDSLQYAGQNSQQAYDPALNRAVPFTLAAGETAVKAVSNLAPTPGDRDNIAHRMVLTAVSSAPRLNAFQPHPSDKGDTSTYFTTDEIDLSFLPSLAPAGPVPSVATLLARLGSSVETSYLNNLFARIITPTGQSRTYGASIAGDVSDALYFLCLSTPTAADKKAVAVRLAKLGVDIWRRFVRGGRPAGSVTKGSFGGGHHWMKAPLVFAARALAGASNAAALASLRQYADKAQRNLFAEDAMIFAVDRANILAAPTPRSGFDMQPFQNYAEGTPDWNSKPSDLSSAAASWHVAYRNIFSPSLAGSIGALRLMGAMDLWNNPMLVAYFDRWVNWLGVQGVSQVTYYPDFSKAMIAAYWPSYSTAVPAIARTVARDAQVWHEFDKLLSVAAIPPASAFAVQVNGVGATVSSVAISGYSLAVTLASAIPQGATVTLSYTQPATGRAVTLGGTPVPTIPATSAVNLTGQLPPSATAKQLVRSTVATGDFTNAQYTKAPAPNAAAGPIRKLLIGQRFRLYSRQAGATILSNATGSTTAFKSYLTAPADHRILVLGQQMRLPGFWSAGDDGTTVTMWTAFDWTKTTAAEVMRASKNGGVATQTGSTVDVAGTTSFDPTTLFNAGFGLFAIPNTGASPADMAHLETWIDWGDAAFAMPASLTAAPFSSTADWGGNGQLVTGTAPRYYYAGTLDDYSSLINRGSGPPASMTPQRTFDQGGDPTPYPFTLGS